MNQSAGRLLFIGVRGHSVKSEPALRELAAEGLIGGVLLLQRNCDSRAQLQELCHSIHELPSPHPLYICIDQEGGRVLRLPWQSIPSAHEVASGMTVAQAEELYAEVALELRELGVDWNLAPVVDLNIDPTSPAIGLFGRSFSDDAATVSAYAAALVRAHRRHGVRTCHKHYPGHGSAGLDSHKGLPDITATWQPRELVPYEQLMAQGMVDAIMTGHVLHCGVDVRWPASLSVAHVAGLRNRLGWQGAVVMDDVQMGALAHLGDPEALMLRALGLGTDIFLAGNWLICDLELPRRWAALARQAMQHDDALAQALAQSIARLERLFSTSSCG